MKIVHTSDFHLEKSFKSSSISFEFSDLRRKNIWKSVENLVDQVQKTKADYLFIVGDLFEEDYFTLTDGKRLFDLLSKTEAKVYIVFGNHDPLNKDSVIHHLEIPENVRYFKNEISFFDEEDCRIFGISYDHYEFRSNFLDSIDLHPKKKNLLLLHTDLLHPNKNYCPVSLEELKNIDFDYIALGHIHKPERVDDKIYYSGSPEPLSFNDIGQRGALLIDLEDFQMDWLDTSESIFLEEEFEIDGYFSFYDLKEKIENIQKKYNKDIYLRIHLKGFLESKEEIIISELENELKDSIHYLEIVNSLEETFDYEKIYEHNEFNMIGQFIRQMKEKDIEDPVHKKALDYGLKALLRGL